MPKCRFNLAKGETGVAPQECGMDAESGEKRCHSHRNDLPAWAQYAIDRFFPSARVSTWAPGDGVTRYRIESADGSRDLTCYYLGRRAFLDAIRMLHAADRYAGDRTR